MLYLSEFPITIAAGDVVTIDIPLVQTVSRTSLDNEIVQQQQMDFNLFFQVFSTSLSYGSVLFLDHLTSWALQWNHFQAVLQLLYPNAVIVNSEDGTVYNGPTASLDSTQAQFWRNGFNV